MEVNGNKNNNSNDKLMKVCYDIRRGMEISRQLSVKVNFLESLKKQFDQKQTNTKMEIEMIFKSLHENSQQYFEQYAQKLQQCDAEYFRYLHRSSVVVPSFSFRRSSLFNGLDQSSINQRSPKNVSQLKKIDNKKPKQPSDQHDKKTKQAIESATGVRRSNRNKKL